MPRILSTCSKIVFRSFRRFEKAFDKINRFVGPLFVGIALFAISGCAFAFFEVVYPQQFLREGTSWSYTVIGTLYCWYMVIMFSFHVCSSSFHIQRNVVDEKSQLAVLQSDHDSSRFTSRSPSERISHLDLFLPLCPLHPSLPLHSTHTTRTNDSLDPIRTNETAFLTRTFPFDTLDECECECEQGRSIREELQEMSTYSDGSPTSEAGKDSSLQCLQDLHSQVRSSVRFPPYLSLQVQFSD